MSAVIYRYPTIIRVHHPFCGYSYTGTCLGDTPHFLSTTPTRPSLAFDPQLQNKAKFSHPDSPIFGRRIAWAIKLCWGVIRRDWLFGSMMRKDVGFGRGWAGEMEEKSVEG